MTFLRTSASCAPSNFGTPARFAACAAEVKHTPANSARQPNNTRESVVVTRPQFSIRIDRITRTPIRRWRGGVLAATAVLSTVIAGCATSSGRGAGATDGVIFDRTSPYGRVLIIDEGARRVMRFGSRQGSEQSATVPGDPRAVPVEYVRYALLGLAHHGRAARVLMVGLGGGTFTTLVHRALPEASL